jgi:hypothetical protein
LTPEPSAVLGLEIDGDAVVWVQGGAGPTTVMYYDLNWLGTGAGPKVLAAHPAIPHNEVAIGDQYISWTQVDLTTGDRIVLAVGRDNQALDTPDPPPPIPRPVGADPDAEESASATSGAWVVWWARYLSAAGSVESELRAFNMRTREFRTIRPPEPGANILRPSIHGDLIAYASDAGCGAGNVYIYRISDGATFQITGEDLDQRQVNVFGDLVAYAANRSGTDDVFVSGLEFPPDNQAPVADAGEDETVHPGTPVTLDGSGSSDPDLDPLSYAWTIASAPAGSGAALSDPGIVAPSFTPDLLGDYEIDLVVTDAHGVASAPDRVVISTFNTAPVADAGPDQALIVLGTTVGLDGRASFDLDGDEPLTYAWTLLETPEGSAAALSDPTSPTPTFVADAQGSYRARLVVTDTLGATSNPTAESANVVASFENVPPVADAGGNQAVLTGETVQLDGSASSDANGDPLSYAWSFVSVPTGSLAVIDNSGAAQTWFVPDASGVYVLSLVVNDGFVDSDPANVTVVATSQPDAATEVLEEAIGSINGLLVDVFKNPRLANPLTLKIGAVIVNIADGLFAEAHDKLVNDVLPKTDGCATGGAPDRNDWILDCDAQAEVYPLLLEAIAMLEDLL